MSTIEQLPEELLIELLAYLSASDTNNLRLACKSLYKNSQWYYIMKKRYFLHFGYSEHEIVTTLTKCCPINPEWFLIGLDLNSSVIFRPNYCDQLEKLTLYYCDLTYNAFKEIVGCCPRLRSLEIHSDDKNGERFVAGFVSDTSMIVHQNLETFQLLQFHSNLWRLLLVRIFNLFPNIRTLTCTNEWDRYTYLDNTAVSLPDIYTEAPSLKNIERLKLNIIIDTNLFHNLDNLSQCRLTEIHFRIEQPAMYTDVLQFLCNQKQLESLELSFHYRFLDSFDDPIKIILLMVLADCFCLRKIVFNVDSFPSHDSYGYKPSYEWWKIDISYEEFCAIVDSSLVYLDVPFNITNIEVPNKHLLNKSLQTLILHSSEILLASTTVVLKHFRELKHLKLYSVSDTLLQTIFKYHSTLLSLYITILADATAFGFTGKGSDRSLNDWPMFDEGGHENVENGNNEEENGNGEETYSIKRLRNLQCLTFPIIDNEHVVSEFVFPALKHLDCTRINAPYQMSSPAEKWLEHFAKNSPSLKVIHTVGISSLRTWKTPVLLSRFLKNLFYFSAHYETDSHYVHYMFGLGTDNVQIEFFESICSLRLVETSAENLIAWNPFTKVMSSKSLPSIKRHYFECPSPIHHSKEYIKSPY